MKPVRYDYCAVRGHLVVASTHRSDAAKDRHHDELVDLWARSVRGMLRGRIRTEREALRQHL